MTGEDADLAQVTEQPFASGVRLTVTGEMDLANASSVGAQLQEAARRHPGTLILDISGLTFLDSRGVAVLHRLHRDLQDAGRTLYIRVGQDTLASRLAQITKLDTVWNLTREPDTGPRTDPKGTGDELVSPSSA